MRHYIIPRRVGTGYDVETWQGRYKVASTVCHTLTMALDLYRQLTA